MVSDHMVKLLQETKIVFTEQAKVLHLVFEHGDPFDTHAESEAGVLIAVDTAVFQYRRVHHATAKDLHPARPFTNITTTASADQATDVHFGAGFGEREVRWPEPDLHILSEHFLHEEI